MYYLFIPGIYAYLPKIILTWQQNRKKQRGRNSPTLSPSGGIWLRGRLLKNRWLKRGVNIRGWFNMRLSYTLNEVVNNQRKKDLSRFNGIKYRCYNPNCPSYHRYGGRGISLYAGWLNDFESFYQYISALAGYGEWGLTLDRINNDGNYEPGNLRWATGVQQQQNRAQVRPGTNAKLSESVIPAIRGLFETMDNESIAAKYGVHPGTIKQVRDGFSWAWVK